jgi:hypothetical protein
MESSVLYSQRLLSRSCKESSLRENCLLLNMEHGFIVWDCESGREITSATIEDWPSEEDFELSALSPDLKSVFVQKQVSEMERLLICYSLTGQTLFTLSLTSLTEITLGLYIEPSTDEHYYTFKGYMGSIHDNEQALTLKLLKTDIKKIDSISFDPDKNTAEIIYHDKRSVLQSLIPPSSTDS